MRRPNRRQYYHFPEGGPPEVEDIHDLRAVLQQTIQAVLGGTCQPRVARTLCSLSRELCNVLVLEKTLGHDAQAGVMTAREIRERALAIIDRLEKNHERTPADSRHH